MKIRTAMALLAVMVATSATFAAEPGADTYKAKCQMCHGAAGLADSPAGKTMKVKPITDPSVKKLTEAEMITATKNGMGKMQPFKDKLTEAQVKDAVAYFRTFLK
jgi:mono/diheme cytochrome c family protein